MPTHTLTANADDTTTLSAKQTHALSANHTTNLLGNDTAILTASVSAPKRRKLNSGQTLDVRQPLCESDQVNTARPRGARHAPKSVLKHLAFARLTKENKNLKKDLSAALARGSKSAKVNAQKTQKLKYIQRENTELSRQLDK